VQVEIGKCNGGVSVSERTSYGLYANLIYKF